MTVIHIVNEGDMAQASGVGTFVRHVDAELRARGVDSRIVTTWNAHNPQPTTLNPLILHLHGLWTMPQHRAAVWARRNGVPVVWSTHGMTAPWAMRHKWWKKFLPWHLYQRRDLKGVALIHCTTDLEAEWNRALGFSKTCVVPLGTTLPGVQPISNPDPENQTLPNPQSNNSSRTLLFVGRIYPVKAIDRLIEAFALALRSNPTISNRKSNNSSWTLRLVGPDQAGHAAELMTLCGRLGLAYSMPSESTQSVVQFVGPKYGEDLEYEYRNCTALALVSHTENFGATVVDALAHGKPVITSTNTPWKIVADRGCGWWVGNAPEPLASALSQLFNLSDDRLFDMGRRGRALAEERYTWPAVAKAMVAAYRQIVRDVTTSNGGETACKSPCPT